MKWGVVTLGAIFMVVNFVSCERVGVINFVGPEEEVIFVNSIGMPISDGAAYDLQYAVKRGIPYRFVNQTWAYVMVISFIFLTGIFPPYRWLFYGIIGCLLLSLWSRDR